MVIALNADVGEGLGSDRKLYPYLQQASIACGGHAGDVTSMRSAVKACLTHGVIIGAHPSYPDRENFGRVSSLLNVQALSREIQQQVSSLQVVCRELKAKLSYVKPHGALYNDMMVDPIVFKAVLASVATFPQPLDLMVGAMPVTNLYRSSANELGVTLITEAFADRLYQDNGLLSDRQKEGAVFDHPNKIIDQVKSIVQHQALTSESLKTISIEAESICIHGDNLASVKAVKEIAKQLALVSLN